MTDGAENEAGRFWLSFADADRPIGQQSLGVCIIAAKSFTAAITEASRIGINPGGEVAGGRLPIGAEAHLEENRLYSAKEMGAMGFPTIGELEAEGIEVGFEGLDFVCNDDNRSQEAQP